MTRSAWPSTIGAISDGRTAGSWLKSASIWTTTPAPPSSAVRNPSRYARPRPCLAVRWRTRTRGSDCGQLVGQAAGAVGRVVVDDEQRRAGQARRGSRPRPGRCFRPRHRSGGRPRRRTRAWGRRRAPRSTVAVTGGSASRQVYPGAPAGAATGRRRSRRSGCVPPLASVPTTEGQPVGGSGPAR